MSGNIDLRSCFLPASVCALLGVLLFPNFARSDLVGSGNFGGTANLAAIDENTGTGTVIGPLGTNLNIAGLAFDPNTTTLYGSDILLAGNYVLTTIDPKTGAATVVGNMGVAGITGLAFDINSGTLYGSSHNNAHENLFVINTSTGAASQIGAANALGFPSIAGLAYDPNNDILYGVDSILDELVTINTTTGVATKIADLNISGSGVKSVFGLAFDAKTGTLFGTSDDDNALYTINTTSGLMTELGPLGIAGTARGLAIVVPEPATGLMACMLGAIGLLVRRRP